jgi:RNA polymerase sigma factor (sigma-70 family)
MTQSAPSRMLSDVTIARRAAGGNQRAFAAIFERYHQDLFRYCAAILGNAEDAHDAVQNTMLKVLRALPGEKRELKLKPWLYRIAHNEAIDMIRARRDAVPIEAELLASSDGPAEAVEARGRLRQLISDIAELPASQRSALVMREMSGLSYEQIGEALETSAAAARQTTYEARLGLRQMSEGREMPCQEVMRAISDDEGRPLRRRDIRAHLRRCEGCRAFQAEISARRREFASLAPLPAAVSAGILQSLLGGAAGGTNGASGAAGVAAGKALAGSVAVKSAAAVVAISAIGVVAADQSGVVHLGTGNGNRAGVEVSPDAAQEPGRTTAAPAQPDHVAAPGRSRPLTPPPTGQGKIHRASRASIARAGSQGTPALPSPPVEQTTQSRGRHLGRTKGAEHGNSRGKPEHPAKGKKSPGATPPGQSKSPGRAKHAGSAEAGGKPASESHPEHPSAPEHSQATATPGPEAEPPATEGSDGKQDSAAAE